MSDAQIKAVLQGSKHHPRALRIALTPGQGVHVSITARPSGSLRRIGIDIGSPIGYVAAYFQGPLGFGVHTFTLKRCTMYIGLAGFELAEDEAALVRERFEGHGLVVETVNAKDATHA